MSRYIDADDIKMAMSLYGFSSPDQTITEFVEDTLPTADVRENVKGEWILHQDSKTWECSVCHEYQVVWSNFCMHCGADMRGGKNERE